MSVKIDPWVHAGANHEEKRHVLAALLSAIALLCLWATVAACSQRFSADSTRWEPPSPKGALMRSVLYPGWGQLANGKPYKACVVFAVEAYLAGVALSSDRNARDAGRLARVAATQEEARSFDLSRTRYNDRRNAHFWWLGAAMLYSMLDAYVDANLAGVSEGASKPPPVLLDSRSGADGGIELAIGVRF